MEKVTAYKTTDNKLWSKEQDAKDHQIYLDFVDWYPENRIMPNPGADEMYFWLLEHAERVLEILDES